MAFKLYISGNVLYIVDTVTNIQYEGKAKDCLHRRIGLSSTDFYFSGLNNLPENKAIPFADIQDKNGDPISNTYASAQLLSDYLDTELGKYSPQASGAITVNQKNVGKTLGGVIDSSKVYIIDGVVDLQGLEIEIPAGGLSMIGYTFDISKLICSSDNYTMFKSPLGGSGNVLSVDIAIEVTGLNSKVFDLVSSTGFDASEFTRINFNNCTSLGVIDGYRQGLESGTGRFGGKPELELKGNWVGGFFIDTSIVRALVDGNYSLYKAGDGFLMNSRFRSNQNIDLPANVSFLDFTNSNFTNPSTLDLDGCIITREGVSNPEDTNIIPNMNKGDLASMWTGNQGIKNTFVGGRITVSSELTTLITDSVSFFDINAVYIASNLEHFDNPILGQLRHLGNNPREYRVFFNGIVDSSSGNVLDLKLVKWDNSSSSFIDLGMQTRQVNALVGSRDVAFFNYVTNVELDKNDYVKFQIRNRSGNDVTLEIDGSYIVEVR